MTPRRIRRALAATLATLVVVASVAPGCGSSESDPPGGGGTPVAADELVPALAAAACAYSSRCSATSLASVLEGEDCLAYFTQRFEDGELGVVVKLVGEGKLSYDAALAGKCVAKYGGASCDDPPDLDGECDAIAVGSTKMGDGCSLHEECGPDGYCDSSGTCPGSCKPRLRADGPCRNGGVCEVGSTCFQPSQKCERNLAEGAQCASIPCADGLVCEGQQVSKGVPGVCRKPSPTRRAKLGEACDLLNDGPFCDGDGICELQGELTETAKFRCVPPYTTGAACRVAAPDGCPAGEYCPVDLQAKVYEGSCTKLPALGEPCAAGLGDALCGAEATCVAGKCAAIQRLGSPCTVSGDDCYSGTCEAGVCVAPLDCGRTVN